MNEYNYIETTPPPFRVISIHHPKKTLFPHFILIAIKIAAIEAFFM